MPKKNDSEQNQPERLWLAELEARVDRLEHLGESDWLLLDTTAVKTLDLLRDKMERQRQSATFCGRLLWLVRG